MKLPELGEAKRRYLSEDEVEAIADAIAPRYRALIVLTAWTGLRFGEAAALRTENVHLLQRRLWVVEGVSEVSGEIHIGPPKTKRSRRSVPIPASVCDELAAHIGVFGLGGRGLIFTDSKGGYLRERNFRRRIFLPAAEAALGSPVRFHDLRHSYVAISIARGVHMKAISERLGHQSIKTTMDIYGGLLPGVDEADADLLDGARSRALARKTESSAASQPASGGVVVGLG